MEDHFQSELLFFVDIFLFQFKQFDKLVLGSRASLVLPKIESDWNTGESLVEPVASVPGKGKREAPEDEDAPATGRE